MFGNVQNVEYMKKATVNCLFQPNHMYPHYTPNTNQPLSVSIAGQENLLTCWQAKMPQLRDSSGIKAFSSSFLQRSIILSIPNIIKSYLHVCLSVSAPVVWLRCRRNNIFSLLVCLCPGGGWAGLGWAGLGWAGGHHSAFFCVTSSLACFIISGIRPGRATAQDTKLRETRACLLIGVANLLVCRILNQTKGAQIKQLHTVSSGVHSCGKKNASSRQSLE